MDGLSFDCVLVKGVDNGLIVTHEYGSAALQFWTPFCESVEDCIGFFPVDMSVLVSPWDSCRKRAVSEPFPNALRATCIGVNKVGWPTGIDYSDTIPFLEER